MKQEKGNPIALAATIILAITLAVGMISLLTPEPTEPTKPTKPTESTYMGITRQEYLDTVSNGGEDKGAHCVYTYLIDTYGIEETYRMDYRAEKDETDVDPAVYEAIDRCL